METPKQLTRKEALYAAWSRGLLSYKFDPCQKEIYQTIQNSNEKINVVFCSRRIGKTAAALLIAFQYCLAKPNTIVKFLAPTKLMLAEIVIPVVDEVILNDCPEEFKPRYLRNRYKYEFANGSQLQLAGNDAGHAKKLRGGFAHLCVVDEAQDCDGLLDAVRSILIPTTLNTRGKIVILGTAPKDPEHDFLKFIEQADYTKSLVKKTIYDNPRIKPEEIDEIIKAYPNGVNNTEFRQEFLCEIIRDPSLVVVPEFTEEIEKEIVKDWPLPPHFDCYESMDVGFKDMTVILFGYYDFRAAKVIIQDEIVLQGHAVQIPVLISKIQETEKNLWTNIYTNEIKKPRLQVADNNLIVLEEINRVSKWKINFIPAEKDDKDAAVNRLRVLVANKKIIISPKCETLIRHLRTAKWSKKQGKRVFDRGADGGHADALDSCIYFVRHVDYTHNPYPNDFGKGFIAQDFFATNPSYWKNNNSNVEIFKKIFNMKARK